MYVFLKDNVLKGFLYFLSFFVHGPYVFCLNEFVSEKYQRIGEIGLYQWTEAGL